MITLPKKVNRFIYYTKQDADKAASFAIEHNKIATVIQVGLVWWLLVE